MRKITLVLFIPVALLFFGMKGKEQSRWSFNIYPLQDTLVQGVRNKVELLQDGKPVDSLHFSIKGNAEYDRSEKIILTPLKGTAGKEFTFEVSTKQDSLLLLKKIPVVANKGNIKKRVEILLQQKIY